METLYLRPNFKLSDKILETLVHYFYPESKDKKFNLDIRDQSVFIKFEDESEVLLGSIQERLGYNVLFIDPQLLIKTLAKSGFIIEPHAITIFPYRRYYSALFMNMQYQGSRFEYPDLVYIPVTSIVNIQAGVRSTFIKGRKKFYTLFTVITLTNTYSHPLPKPTIYLQYQIAELIFNNKNTEDVAELLNQMQSFLSLN